MAAITPVHASGSTDGMAILVVQTATAGTTIHTAVSGSTSYDEVWLYAYNSDTVTRNLTIEFGNATAPDHNIVVPVTSKTGLLCVVPGLRLNNSATVKAFADAASKVTITAMINRYA
jgi:hypothetical protein